MLVDEVLMTGFQPNVDAAEDKVLLTVFGRPEVKVLMTGLQLNVDRAEVKVLVTGLQLNVVSNYDRHKKLRPH